MIKRSALLLLAILVPASAPAQAKSISPEIRQLRNEIAAIKLDRVLNLTRDQVRALVPLLKQTSQLRDQLRAEQEKRKPEILQALTAVRDDLAKSGVVSEASRKALEQARGEGTLNELRAKSRAVMGSLREPTRPTTLGFSGSNGPSTVISNCRANCTLLPTSGCRSRGRCAE